MTTYTVLRDISAPRTSGPFDAPALRPRLRSLAPDPPPQSLGPAKNPHSTPE